MNWLEDRGKVLEPDSFRLSKPEASDDERAALERIDVDKSVGDAAFGDVQGKKEGSIQAWMCR